MTRLSWKELCVFDPVVEKGFGRKLMKHLIAYAKRRGVKEIVVHGQVKSMKFYEKSGFKRRGRIFMDGGMRHYEFFMKV
jgi:predicted GNAT family N-acyltransferase